MKVQSILAFAALGSAFVLPDEQVSNLEHVEEEGRRSLRDAFDRLPSKDDILSELQDTFGHASEEVQDVFDRFSHEAESKYDHYSGQSKDSINDAFSYAQDTREEVEHEAIKKAGCAKKWFNAQQEKFDEAKDMSTLGHGHHGHHDKPNRTVYELITESKYTTKLAKLVNEYDDLVEALNGTSANFTVFAPTDRAFEKVHLRPPPFDMTTFANSRADPR